MSCTFWNLRRRKAAEKAKASKATAPAAEKAKVAEETAPKPEKKGGGKSGK